MNEKHTLIKIYKQIKEINNILENKRNKIYLLQYEVETLIHNRDLLKKFKRKIEE